MIPLIVTIPSIVALILLVYWTPARVVQWVYLPSLVFVPMYFNAMFGGIFVRPVTLMLLPLAIAGLLARWSRLRLSLLDFAIVLFLFSTFYADAHHRPVKIAIYATISTLFDCVLPYVLGRTLIEQSGMRTKFVQTIVLLLSALAILSLFEFRLSINPFELLVQKITHTWNFGWREQMRWGFGRVAGPYATAICAGMMFTTGLILQLWLLGQRRWNIASARMSLAHARPLLITGILLFGLFETQSRGPWIGCILGLFITAIGFARDRKRAAYISLTLFAACLSVAAVALDNYTDTRTDAHVDNEDRQNAVYRRELWDTYKPLIDEGGFWGWGSPFPTVNGEWAWSPRQPSIDNEYIRLMMAQGYFGAGVFVLCVLLGLGRLLLLANTFSKRGDVLFVYCMIGAILAVSLTITTVYLAQPMVQVFFLLLGWSQSITGAAERANRPAIAETVFV